MGEVPGRKPVYTLSFSYHFVNWVKEIPGFQTERRRRPNAVAKDLGGIAEHFQIKLILDSIRRIVGTARPVTFPAHGWEPLPNVDDDPPADMSGKESCR